MVISLDLQFFKRVVSFKTFLNLCCIILRKISHVTTFTVVFNRRLNTIIMSATIDPQPATLRQNVTLSFRNLKVIKTRCKRLLLLLLFLVVVFVVANEIIDVGAYAFHYVYFWFGCCCLDPFL